MTRRNITANLEKQAWKPCKIDNKMTLTLIDAVEQVVMLAESSELCPQFFRSAKRPLQYICDKFSMTVEQAALLSAFINFSDDRHLSISDIARFFKCSQIKMLRMSKDVDLLIRRRIIGRQRGYFYVKNEALRAVQNDAEMPAEDIDNLTLPKFFATLQQYLDDMEHEEAYNFDMLVGDLDTLFEKNSQLPFVIQLRELSLSRIEEIVFLKACSMMVNEDDRVICQDDYRPVLEYKGQAHTIAMQINNGTSGLIKACVIEPICDDGEVRSGYCRLTDRVCIEMLSEVGVSVTPAPKTNFIKCEDITAKPLFYNENEEAQVSQLESLLQPARFTEVCDRLSDKGMRRGFACIFHGGPGTGKTETALQLARKTGRDIMPVNVSQLRDKYVGESEKRVKALFDNYRKAVEKSDVAPILLFNEADAIISKRSENVTRSVDKMENALQNIILQEMENLEGILIATTNLTQNLDSAFERRFLYKVQFERPSIKAKQAIWQSMIPDIDEATAKTLASEYDFSGGQIENIARKQTVEQVLSGIEPSLESLRKICNAEFLHTRSNTRRLGY